MKCIKWEDFEVKMSCSEMEPQDWTGKMRIGYVNSEGFDKLIESDQFLSIHSWRKRGLFEGAFFKHHIGYYDNSIIIFRDSD